eukprot:6455714-Amphidinium_carterae.1
MSIVANKSFFEGVVFVVILLLTCGCAGGSVEEELFSVPAVVVSEVVEQLSQLLLGTLEAF